MDDADFTEEHYRLVLRKAAERYLFATFEAPPDAPHVLWRHDIDISPHRALAVARIEAEEGVRSTYCVLLHGEFYNLLERGVTERVREIVGLGHSVGLHFDAGFSCPHDADELTRLLTAERRIIEQTLECPVNVFSFHNGDLHNMLRFRSDRIAGMVNAYGRQVFGEYEYVSDSNGYWRFERLMDVLRSTKSPRLHVLTHPEWWQARAMSPDERVTRAIVGRGQYVRREYDRVLARGGRHTTEPGDSAPEHHQPVTVGQILALLPDATPVGHAPSIAAEVHRPVQLSDAKPGTITFLGPHLRVVPEELAAAMVIIDERIADKVDLSRWAVDAAVVSPTARLDFIRTVEHYFAPVHASGIHPTAHVTPGARLADDVSVGPGATIAGDVEIGAGSVLCAGVHVYDGTRIGQHVTIQAGAVIGAEGFGFERDADGRPRIFPHLGGVVIGDHAGVGANTCIDRGTLGDTVIGPGAQLDNLVHIAHNVTVGENAVVIAQAFVGGGASVGARSWIAPGAVVRDGIVIGADALVGMGAVVARDVAAGITVVGIPARPVAPVEGAADVR